jgi:hypothetical protein
MSGNPTIDALLQPPKELTPAEKDAAAAAARAALGNKTTPLATARTEALAKIAAFKGNPEWLAKYQAGDVASVREWRDAHKAASAPPDAGESEAQLADQIASQVKYGFPDPASDLGKDLIGYLSGKKAITPVERRQVEARKQSLMSDGEWAKRFLGGDLAARQQMRIITTLLTAKVEAA